MSFLDKVKELRDRFLGRKRKRLNAPGKNGPKKNATKKNTTKNNVSSKSANKPVYRELPKTIDQYKLEVKTPPIMSLDTPEGAIEQYLNCLLYNRKNNKQISSYGALTSIGGMEDTMHPGRNQENENIVINNIKADSRYSLYAQNSADGKPAFHHVIKGARRSEAEVKERLYLNCRRENVALLANELLKELNDMDSFYFKFDADAQMQRTSRPEKFVFYLTDDPKELDRIVNGIENVKARRPELFKDSNIKNPFLKSFDFISYASQPQTDEYKALNGTTQKVSKSYNSFLATALNDSYYRAIRETVARDYNLSEKTMGLIFDNSEMYTLSSLEDVMENPKNKSILFENMKKNLQICKKKNPVLDIAGLQLAQALPNQENVNIATNQQTGNIRPNQHNDVER